MCWLLVSEGFSPSVRESMAEQLSSGNRDLCWGNVYITVVKETEWVRS